MFFINMKPIISRISAHGPVEWGGRIVEIDVTAVLYAVEQRLNVNLALGLEK